MARKTPTITDNVLRVYNPESERLITELDLTDKQDWKYWQEFLSHNKSFRYVEQTPNRSYNDKLHPNQQLMSKCSQVLRLL